VNFVPHSLQVTTSFALGRWLRATNSAAPHIAQTAVMRPIFSSMLDRNTMTLLPTIISLGFE
jgi:hypothetical protein